MLWRRGNNTTAYSAPTHTRVYAWEGLRGLSLSPGPFDEHREPLTFAGTWENEGASGVDWWPVSSRTARAAFKALLTLLWLHQR